MKYFLTTLTCIFFVSFSFSQKWGRITESAYTTEATDVETDALGNSYVTGYITGETAFSVTTSFPSAPGNGDIYVAKYNSTGDLLWVKRFGGSYSDRAYDLCLDNSGNIFITGQFFGTVNFDGNSITSNANSKDIFLTKLDNNGIAIWAISEGGSDVENAYGITCDNLGNVILTGQFKGNSILNGQSFSSMIDPLTSLPTFDLFISKYNTNGSPLWIQTGSAKYEDRGLAISCDDANNIYLSAQFSDTLTFAGNVCNNNAYNVGFIAKLSPAGSLTWFNTIRASFLLPYDLEVKYDKLHVTGDSRGTIIYQNNGNTQYTATNFDNAAFILKTNLSGQQIWLETVGSDDDISAKSISLDVDSNIFVTGNFKCTLTELHENNTALYNSVGFKDVFLWKLNPGGAFEYLKASGSKLDDTGNGVAILGIDDAVICGSNIEHLNIPTTNSLTYEVDNSNYFNFDYFDQYIDIQNNYNPIYNNQMYNGPFIHLNGDESANAFLTNAIHTLTPEYNFFFGEPTDSLDLIIYGPADTVNFCEKDTLFANPQTYIFTGPEYNFSWSTGGMIDTTIINSTNTYWLYIERLDECANGQDSIVEIYNANPNLPLLTDNLGLAIQEPGSYYYNYNFCYPDSVEWWFTDLDTNLSLQISSDGITYFDTLPHTYFNDAYVTVQSEFCQSTGLVDFTFDYVSTYDYNPFLTLIEEMDYNDSIILCFSDTIRIQNHDFQNNPTGQYNVFPNDPIVWMNWSVTLNGSVIATSGDDYEFWFFPSQTGNYIVQCSNSVGYNNLCGLDTTNFNIIDTFFIEVLPTPIPPISPILGDNQLCPNGSVYLKVNSTVPSYYWDGPGVIWVSTDTDSAQVTVAGTYTYGGTFVDPINGCSDTLFNYFTLAEKTPPEITLNPTDAIICPYDSIYMSVPNEYTSYEWFGPNGSGLSTTFEHWDDDQGMYYVTVLDDEGCYLTSPQYELMEYSTPYLSVEPTNFICDGDETTITAVIFGDGVFQWQNPLNYPNEELTVNQAGWYVCSMTQCGITTIDSVQIMDGSFSISLNYSDSILCYNEDVLLSTTSGLTDYQWNNPEVFGSSILIQEPGQYFVTAINSYGCEATSDTAFFTSVEASEPPSIADTFSCVAGVINIENNLSANWYSADSTLISSGSSFMPNIESDTLFLVSYAPNECPIVFDEFSIEFNQDIPLFEILGDSIICSGSPIDLSVNSSDEDVNWMMNGVSIGSVSEITINPNQLSNGDSVIAIISSPCYVDTIFYIIQLFDEQPLTPNQDSIILCSGETETITLNSSYSSILWSINGIDFLTSTLNLNTIDFSSGIISVSAIDSNGCNTATSYINLIIPDISVNISTYGTHCEHDSIHLTAISSEDSILWTTPFGRFNDLEINLIIGVSTIGSYTLESWDENGCSNTIQIELEMNSLPVNQLPNDTIVCASTDLADKFSNSEYDLTFSEPFSLDSMLAGVDGWYNFILENADGCVTADSILLTIEICGSELPNVLTSNGDGINDLLIFSDALTLPNNLLVILNRWGTEVYRENGYRNDFDGADLLEGVYFYLFYRDVKTSPNEFEQNFFHLLK